MRGRGGSSLQGRHGRIESNFVSRGVNFILNAEGRASKGSTRSGLSGRIMSPVIQRQRAKRPNPASDDQHWSMLVFESLSAGAMTVLFGFVLITVVVGIFVILVWPLTYWDLTNTGLEKYGEWTSTVLWSVFGGGSLAGFWFFSGAAFRVKAQSRAGNGMGPGAKASRRSV